MQNVELLENTFLKFKPFITLPDIEHGLAFSPSSAYGENYVWIGFGNSIFCFLRDPSTYPTTTSPYPELQSLHQIRYKQKADWWKSDMNVADLAITKDGSRIFVADSTNGFVHYFDTQNIPANIDDQYSPIMESYGAYSISICDDYVYWLGDCDPNDGRQNPYPTPSVLLHSLNLTQSGGYGYHPWIPIPKGKYPSLMKVVAAKNYAIVVSPGDTLAYVVAGAPFNFQDTGANILQTIKGSFLQDLTIMPDNSRLIIAALDGVEVWNANLVPE